MIKRVKQLKSGDVFYFPQVRSVFTVISVGKPHYWRGEFSRKTYLIIPLILVRKDGKNFQFSMYDQSIPVIGQSTKYFTRSSQI